MGIKGQNDGTGAFADTGDTVEQPTFFLEVGMVVNVAVDGVGELLDVSVQLAQMLLNILADRIA